jgi:predicted PurR-regulated permease PerM
MSVEPKPIRLSPVGKFITIAIIVALAIALIWAIGPVMTPFVAAAITAYLFNPLIGWLHRTTGVGRALWIGVLYIMVGGLVYALVRFLGPIIAAQYTDLRHQIPKALGNISRYVADNRTIDIGGLAIDIGPFEESLLRIVSDLGRDLPATVPHLVITAIERVLLFVTYLLVTFYFLLQAEQITNWCYKLIPAPYRAEIRGLGQQVDVILTGYIRGTLLLIPIMTVLTYTALTILGIRYALVIAIASGILEIIPLVGPWSAAGIAVTVSLLQPTTPFGWSHALLALVVGVTYFVLRMAEDNFIIPHVVGHAVHLHPVLVLFAILAGGALGGPFGLLVGIPVVAIMRLLLRYLYRKLVDAPDFLPPPEAPPPASRLAAKATEQPPPEARQASSPHAASKTTPPAIARALKRRRF